MIAEAGHHQKALLLLALHKVCATEIYQTGGGVWTWKPLS